MVIKNKWTDSFIFVLDEKIELYIVKGFLQDINLGQYKKVHSAFSYKSYWY